MGKYKETDLCTAQKDKTSGKTTYIVEGSEVSEEDFQKYLSSLNSTYEELSVNIESTGSKTIPTDESVLGSSYDAYKLGDVVGDAAFAYGKKSADPKVDIPTSEGKTQDKSSAVNPSTGAVAGVAAATVVGIGVGAALVAKRKKK